ncbi:MAG: alpha/beta fold hydrolase [Acidimicrobiales bacterium]|nr:alpha/beta fold hydrolase [Acidimicrobiales bacterium]
MPRTQRSRAVRAWFSRYINAPRYGKHAENLRLRTSDGVALHAVRLAGPDGCAATVVFVHGFANWHRQPQIHRFVTMLAAYANVVVVDLRGHGLSEGVSTFGAHEWLDVAAAVNTVPPTDTLVLLGTSMGAGASVIYAGRAGPETGLRRADAVVAISGPAWWGRVLDLNDSLLTRVVLRFMRVRVGPPLREARIDPVSVVANIAPAPLLVVHDKADWYFGPEHPTAMVREAGANAQLWWRVGGHATDLLTDELLDDLMRELIAQSVLRGDEVRPSQSG